MTRRSSIGSRPSFWAVGRLTTALPVEVQALRNDQDRVGYNLRNFPASHGSRPPDGPLAVPVRHPDAVDSIVNEVYWHAVVTPAPTIRFVVARSADARSAIRASGIRRRASREWLESPERRVLDILSLSRNVGRSGVFGNYEPPASRALINTGYASSVELTALRGLEDD
jgi:hypothetical protein